MDTTTAASLARGLMREHGLDGWVFKFDRAKRRFGQCNYRTWTISLSAPLVALNSEERVRNTILHEIAHALAPGHHHDRVWQATARSIGCDGSRCYSSDAVEMPAGAWRGTCPSCGKHVERHRLTDKGRRAACRACCKGRYDARFVFVWERVKIAA